MRRQILLASAVAVSAAALSAQAPAEWPQLLGATRNANAAPIASGASLTLAWKKPMPSGSAGLAVAGDRVYTLGGDAEQDVLFALDAATGAEAWRLALGKTHANALNGPGATPAIAGGLVLAVTSMCQLHAVNPQTRQIAWTQDLVATFATRYAKGGGCSMAPLVAGPRVVMVTGSTTGGQLAAFDAATGKLAWTATGLPNSVNLAPGWMPQGGGLILYHHSKPPGVSGITAINAETGATVWQIDGTTGTSNATPIAVTDNRVLLETWGHVSLYDVAARKPLWTTKEITSLPSPAVAHKGHVYAFGGQSGEFLTCLDAADGKVKWTSRIYRGHLALAGDTLVVMAEASGLVRLVAADPTAYREIAKVQALTPGARTPTPPSLAGGRIFVRNLDELAAVAVR